MLGQKEIGREMSNLHMISGGEKEGGKKGFLHYTASRRRGKTVCGGKLAGVILYILFRGGKEPSRLP